MRKQFLLALHTLDDAQVMREAALAVGAGVDGILLVNNDGSLDGEDLFRLARKLKDIHPGYVFGVNPLGMSTAEALDMAILHSTYIDILWVDDGGVRETSDGATIDLAIADLLLPKLPHPKYYGGIAFKYKEQPVDLATVAKMASRHFEAVITSGSATGVEPDIEKIKTIKSVIGTTPLGIASGINSSNASKYLPYVDIYIVGSSLQLSKDDIHRYNKDKIKQLGEILHAQD